MCGRYTLTTPATATLAAGLRSRFALGESVVVRRRYNVAPGDEVLAVTTTKEGEPRGEELRWGFVPGWAKSPATGFTMINARAETVAEKPAYKSALKTRRCLIVADGFYEWQARAGRAKLPWHITRTDGAPFAFAGLWAVWHDDAAPDAPLRTCTIITTAANAALAEVHDRMPVILSGHAAEQAWLDHATPAPQLAELLAPLPSERCARRAVGPAVSDARYDGPACLDDAPEDIAASLF